MQALILAGGQGTRLRPYTTILPKPLMPIGDYPILEIILRQLKKAGVDEVILAVGYMSHLFESFFQDGSRYGLRLFYSFEDTPMGTAGPIALAIDRLEKDFLVINGDLLTTLNLGNVVRFHVEKQAAATISIFRRDVKIDFGVIETDGQGKLQRYVEKPTLQYEVNMGVHVLNKVAVQPYLKPGVKLDIPDLMMNMVQDGCRVLCYREDCFWLDIGRLDDYQMANDIFASRQSEFLPVA